MIRKLFGRMTVVELGNIPADECPTYILGGLFLCDCSMVAEVLSLATSK